VNLIWLEPAEGSSDELLFHLYEMTSRFTRESGRLLFFKEDTMNRTRLLTTMALLVAVGTLGAQFIWFPAGIAKAYPVQHAVNVLAAILLGPGPAVVIAFLISLLRNILGLGSLLAFPGAMIGALLAGLLYRKFQRSYVAAIGEVIGTGIIGALAAVPFAKIFMGTTFGALFFLPPFLISSVSGALLALFLVTRVNYDKVFQMNQKLK